jgi:nanoRNase/pAp phosphatase (c-di-AMP/oligoRNAs hydrolase)
MSAAIVKRWASTQNYRVQDELYEGEERKKYNKIMDFIGWDYGDNIPDLSEYDKVIMCDISFPVSSMEYLADNVDFIWIDHHVGPIRGSESFANYTKGLRNSSLTTHELTWLYFFTDKPIPKITKLIEIYNDFKY